MRTGALEGVVTDAVARAAERPVDVVRRAAMLSGDLGETARLALTGSEAELAAVGLVVGRPVLPMLAATASSAAAALETTGEASVEYKLDGARIQVHRAGDDVQVFTRNLADVTRRLPEVVEVVRALPVPTSSSTARRSRSMKTADRGPSKTRCRDSARGRARDGAASVVLRRAARRRPRPARRAARDALAELERSHPRTASPARSPPTPRSPSGCPATPSPPGRRAWW